MEYRISNPHFAVIGCSESQRSIHQKLKNLASKNEYLTKRVSELEARNIRIQAANLRTAALRKYKGAGSQISEPKQKGNELIASELDIYAFRMDEQSLIVQSRGSLYGSGLVFLRNSKLDIDRNELAHTDFGELAVALVKEGTEVKRSQVERIFSFIVGQTIEEVAQDWQNENDNAHSVGF